MSRRRSPRGESDRRRLTLAVGRALEGRGARVAALLVLLVAAVVVARHPDVLRPTRDMLLNGSAAGPGLRVRDLPAEDVVLARRRQGLRALLRSAQQGTLLPAGAGALALVDQSLVRDLLAPLFPRSYEVEDTWRVTVTGAQVSFEDGLALVRLDGRASLLGADESVYADVSIFGDLEVLREQPDAAVLRTRINLLALDARRVTVGVEARAAEKIVERLGEARVSAFAAVASGLEIPVRHRYEVDLPAVHEGPVRIAAATLPVQLSVLGVRAIAGKLAIAMGASFEDAPAPGAVSIEPLPAPEALPGKPSPERTAALRQEVELLRAQLGAITAADPLVAAARVPGAQLSVEVGAPLLERAVQELAAKYLDRVRIELEDIEVRREGERRKKTFLGEFVAGRWSLRVRFTRIQGVLRAGRPEVSFPGRQQVAASFPVHLEQGTGQAEVRFAWDSRKLVGLLCRDFELSDTVAGRVEPLAYPVTATFDLTAGRDHLVAQPRFNDRFRIHPRAEPASWAKVIRALEEQDRPGRCGIGVDPAVNLADLRALLERGFVVKLPRKLFRPVRLPTRVTPTVEVQGRMVDLALVQSSLSVGEAGARWGSHLHATVAGPGGPPPGPGESQRSSSGSSSPYHPSPSSGEANPPSSSPAGRLR